MTGKYHKRTAFIFITYFLCTLCFAQVVKTPFPIKSLSWSKNDEAFSLSEGDNIFLRDSNTYELLDSLNVKDVAQFTFSTEGKKQVLKTVHFTDGAHRTAHKIHSCHKNGKAYQYKSDILLFILLRYHS